MRLFGVIAFTASGLLLLLFVLNLMLAANGGALFGTSVEVLTLFAASALFGLGTLIREARSRS
ncbi:hypothetical protein [Paracoccus alkanivorans]|uniref:Uncharacterized protein n=1 Tax=Paracoccus alkanivorans TaxID=2116655 RepID=A0A3M0M6H3_9RHOB|nr:hypothetical protein [Paracoccus alkanivorans]RMC32034.1 hypothetical protein C9E81_19360 [Paracoccus alkanivorans]